ncbi:diacylglycerol kinase [uncultured Sphingomonas sp.]|uniref:diacylglycerol kinase n=1 Tax=uncultured Sphingomonas sp. TaxID=158754 RepID=UPI0025CBC94C|nr:diacylglycerol kinase [uncultured Sphingomonas sp.]
MKGRPLGGRPGFAFAALCAAVRREASFRTQLAFAASTGIALEGVVDLLHPGHHPEIGVGKDIAAGAVLVAAMSAVIVAAAMVVDTLELLR